MTAVDQILRDYGLTEEMALRCIAGMLQHNQAEAAATHGFDVSTAKRYRDAFLAMSEKEMWAVVATLAHRQVNEVVDEGVGSERDD